MAKQNGSAPNNVQPKHKSLPELARKLLNQFQQEDRVLIAISADPDALASALAVKRLLWRRVASLTVARSNEIARPDNLAMVRLLNIPTEPLASIKLGDFTKVVMVDSQPHHNESLAILKPNVVIDHHPPGESLNGVPYLDVRPKYGATSTILTEYLQGAKIKPSARLATALVFGIKNDTSSFQRPSLEEDVKAFKFLFAKANQSMLRKIEFSEMRRKDLELLRLALDKRLLRKHCMFAHLGNVKSPDNLVQIADFFLKVDIVDSSAVSGFYQDKLVVIVRNAAPRGNAGKIAEGAFGHVGSAGGHQAMARAEIATSTLKSSLSDLTEKTVANWVVRRVQNHRRSTEAKANKSS
jgi:nanoRNase/pAp phosphatase (c-di-AMP/oligoRNAs hydrolase)